MYVVSPCLEAEAERAKAFRLPSFPKLIDFPNRKIFVLAPTVIIMADPKYPVSSIGTAFRIIETLDRLGKAGISEIAANANVSNSTVHKHLNTLRSLGYVRKEGTTYALSLSFLGLGIRARSRYDIVRVAKPFVDDLSTTTGGTADLVVLEGSYGLYAYRSPDSIEADNTLPVVGDSAYLHTTAVGKAILAEMEWDEVRKIIDDVGFPEGMEQRTGSNPIRERDLRSIRNYSEDRWGRLIFRLRQELQIVRDQGFAFENNGHKLSAPCVAAAITVDNKPIAAISVFNDSDQPNEAQFKEVVADLVMNSANEIEAKLDQI